MMGGGKGVWLDGEEEFYDFITLHRIFRSLNDGDNVLVIYPKIHVLLSIFKLIRDLAGVENLMWLPLSRTAHENLKRVLHRFRKRIPEDTGNILPFPETDGNSMKGLTELLERENFENKVILGYGIHLQPLEHISNFDAITMSLATSRKGGKLFMFMKGGTVRREKFTLIEDLFDIILKITQDTPCVDQSFVAEVYGPFIPYFELSYRFSLSNGYDVIFLE